MSGTDIEAGFIVAACISAVAGSVVVLTGIIFPSMRERLFMQLVMFMAICDVVASVAAAFGFPEGSLLCPAQSFLVAFFYKAR